MNEYRRLIEALDMWDDIREGRAHKHGCDPDLVRALNMDESLDRPGYQVALDVIITTPKLRRELGRVVVYERHAAADGPPAPGSPASAGTRRTPE